MTLTSTPTRARGVAAGVVHPDPTVRQHDPAHVLGVDRIDVGRAVAAALDLGGNFRSARGASIGNL